MRAIFKAFARNTVFANILLAMIFLAGGMAIAFMVRETFPDLDLDMVTVIVPWPGADPEEVEEGICRKIEEAIESIDGIKHYHTTSRENYGVATIQVDESYDVGYVKERVRNAVDAISTFPPDAERPITEELLFRINVLFLALSSSEMDERQMKEWAESVKEEIRAMPELSQVQVLGTREYEISIEVPEERLREYGLTFGQVSNAVRASSLNLSGGVMRTQGEEIRLRTLGRKYVADEFANIVVLAQPGGDVITLDRIADIHDSFTEDFVKSRFNGQPSVTLGLLRTTEEDGLAIDRAVRDYVDRKRMQLPQDGTMNIAIWGRVAPILEARIRLLLRNGFIGLTLVFIMLWLFLDIRLSFWAGMGMPVSVMGALAILWMIGATINMISLFGLIMVLGIIVDDAIVVGEAIYVARKNGAPPLRAAVDGVMEVGLPVFGAVTTTLVAFLPLLFVPGFIGKLITILPIVVVASLTISLLECLLLLPAHLSHLPEFERDLEKRKRFRRFGQRFHVMMNEGLEWFVAHMYQPFIRQALHWRYVSMAVAVAIALATIGIVQGGFIKFNFFPEIDGIALSSTVEFPDGTPITVTEDAIVKLEEAIQRVGKKAKTVSGKPLIENMFSVSGARIDDKGGAERGNNWGTVRVELLDTAERGIYFKDLIALWEDELGTIPGVESLTFFGDEIAPPGAPIEVWMQGHDIDSLRGAAAKLKQKLATYDGVYQIQDDFRQGKAEVKLHLKPEARALGITVADLATQIFAGFYGEEAIRLQRGRDDIRVRVRYPEDERASIDELEQVRIRTFPSLAALTAQAGGGMAPGAASSMTGMGAQGQGLGGMGQDTGAGLSNMTPAGLAAVTALPGSGIPVVEVPLRSVADLEYGPGYAAINRTDGMRRVIVQAEVNLAKANPNEIVQEIRTTFFEELQAEYPGVVFSFQGEQEELRDSFNSLFISYPLALLGIFIIIATIFRSYLQPLVIMVTVPFGTIGAIVGHMLMGFDLSIMSLFGIVALAGVVVNDAIVLIECINMYIANGESFYDAVQHGGARRFRAIFLTTISTVGGLMPLILEKDFQAQILIPMAISLAGGVAFATVLTLILEPCLLCVLNDFRRIFHWLNTGEWPAPEEVEPARLRYKNTLDDEDETPGSGAKVPA